MSLEIMKIIAALCVVSAGDTNEFNSTVSQVEYSQTKCHAFYAECYGKAPNKLDTCMKKRKVDEDEKFKRK